LLDPEGLKRLADSARAARLGASPVVQFNPTSKVRNAGPTAFAVRATPEEIRATDRTSVRRRSILADIGKFIPDLENADPRNALAILTEEYQEHPSQDGQFLVQDAINRIAHVGEVDGESKKVVSRAIEILTSVKLPGQGGDGAKDSIWSNLYEHPDSRGRSLFAYLGPDSIYQSIQQSYLQGIGLNDQISSLALNASQDEFRGDVIMFQDDRFFGRFTSIRTTINNPTQPVSVSYVGDSINDQTSSVLLVRRYSDETTRVLGDANAKAVIKSIISGTHGVRELRGDPIFTWDMWPIGGDSHPNDPEKRFIQVKIPVVINVPDWFDYDAEIWLWFYLYISGGYLQGYLAAYGAWVEGGLKSQDVLNGIMDALPDQFGAIETTLNAELSTVNGTSRLASKLAVLGPFSTVYLLPGDQNQFTGMAMEGDVEDNVTVVLVRNQMVNTLSTSTVMLV
jgi:hypothetical protein